MLLESQLAHENGEITDNELAEREREILARMRELIPGIGGVPSTDDVESVDVVTDIGDEPE